MSVSYTIEPDRRVVLLTAHGVVSTQDMLEYYALLKSDPRFRPEFDQIGDFRGTNPGADMLSNQVSGLLDRSPFGGTSRRAYVVSPGIGFGMARMGEALAEHRGLVARIFDDIESARQWLGQVRP